MINFVKEVFKGNKLGGNQRAAEQNDDRIQGGYGADYYDEDQQRAGQEKYNLATGEKYDNSTVNELADLSEVAVDTSQFNKRGELLKNEKSDMGVDVLGNIRDMKKNDMDPGTLKFLQDNGLLEDFLNN